MGANTMVVDIDKLCLESFNVKDNQNKYQILKYEKLCKRYGQLDLIKICENQGKGKVIDGLKHLKTLKKLGFKKVKCLYFGKLDDVEYTSLRLSFNYNFNRIDNIGISEHFSTVVKNQIDISNISIKTGIEKQVIQRLSDLLDFDWDKFQRKTDEINNQVDIFKDLEEHGE